MQFANFMLSRFYFIECQVIIQLFLHILLIPRTKYSFFILKAEKFVRYVLLHIKYPAIQKPIFELIIVNNIVIIGV